ncbi:MAG TPA: class I SAM-dependent methyltransferase [Steroidobacteraceae bacterium]|nr:class I SAM-dependent methyltransferase [Steroidobacteraceae bacterium]
MQRLANSEQAALWNGPSGQAWADEQSMLDRTYAGIEALLSDAVAAAGARSVLDIGCGSGATTLAAARRMPPGGIAVGVDISEPLVALARRRVQHEPVAAQFIRADAQAHAFERGRFDLMISRFGVMFFEDPVAAFGNLLLAAARGCATRLVVFRSIEENPFMTTAERAAVQFVPNIPPRIPGAPGQFALADPDRVRRIFEQAGWSRVEVVPIDVPCAFPAADLERFFTRFGPLGLALRNATEVARRDMLQAVRIAFEPFVREAQVRFDAACWMIEARAP